MVIHGGEGLKGQKSGNVSEEEEPLSDFPSSTLDGQGNPSRQMVIPSKLVPGQLPGVCPGDTLQGLKLGPSVKVEPINISYFFSVVYKIIRRFKRWYHTRN